MNLQLIVIQVVTFIAIIIILRMLFYRQLNSALTRLNRLHEENLAKEEELQKQLEEAKAAKEEEMQEARDEAAAIIKDAKAKAEKAAIEFEARSKTEAQSKFEHVKDEIDKIKNDAMAASHEKAVELSLQMLQAVFTEQGKAAFQHELVAEVLDEIKNINKDKFTVKTKDLDVLSACPLNAEDRAKLVKILTDKIGMRVEIKESVDKGIMAGLIVRIGALTIDGSLRNKLRKVQPHIK